MARLAGGTAVAVMRDVEFLLAALSGDPLPADRPVVYRYRSGVLRRRMIGALRKIALGRGLVLERRTPPLPMLYGWMVDLKQLPLVDWSIRVPKGAGTEKNRPPLDHAGLERSLGHLADSLDVPGIHFVEHRSRVGRHPGWAAVERGALVIEEPVVTRESLRPILRYLAANTDLAPGADLLGQRGFVASFAGLIEERANLPAAIQAFEERVLLCTDRATDRYDVTLYRRDVGGRQGRRSLLPHLRDLVALRRERDLVDLLCGFDERRAERGWSAYRLMTELYTRAGRLLEPVSDRRPSRAGERARVAPHRVAEGAVLWAALVLAGEDTFVRGVREDKVGYRRGPDLLVPALSALGRDFLAREDRAEAGDPLAGQWPDVARCLCRCGKDDLDDPLERVRGGLVRALDAALARGEEARPDWFGQLHEEVSAACRRLDVKALRDEVSEDNDKGTGRKLPPLIWVPPPYPLHLNFTSVIGRGHAVVGLRRHARERTDGVDLLLHGPDGVGKRTLAWSYARMVLCARPSDEGAACGGCDPCRATLAGGSGCIEVDGARPDIGALTGQLLKRVRSGAIQTDRFVFVVRNADYYPPEEFDRLLKPMEDGRSASFVLLARDRTRVRLAGQSRCFDYRVRPLDRPEAELFLRTVLAERGLHCDEAVIALLVEAGVGLPRRLLKACDVRAAMGPASLGEFRDRLSLGWPAALAARWPEIVSGAPAELTELTRSFGKGRAKRVRRVRALLRWVFPGEMRETSPGQDAAEMALRYLDDETRAGLRAEIDRQAEREGVTAAVVWARLAEAWMADRLSHG